MCSLIEKKDEGEGSKGKEINSTLRLAKPYLVSWILTIN
jgi:hypothetical protein